MKHFLDVTAQASARDYLDAQDDRVLLVYAPTALRQIGSLKSTIRMVNVHSIGKNIDEIKQFCRDLEIDTVISLGGGTATDIAKYIAHINGCWFTCIPTMLSTNAYATDKVALTQNGIKTTYDAKLADKIILDNELLSHAGMHNLYGLCDVLSIHTALYDWQLAEDAAHEAVHASTYARAYTLLDRALTYTADLSPANRYDIPSLYALIGESGHITNLYGSGRPESGSEHIFAKCLEQLTDLPHGISITIGILLMSLLQDNHSDEVQLALRRIGALQNMADRPHLSDYVDQALQALQPRADRYTILSEKLPDEFQRRQLIDCLQGELAYSSKVYAG